MTPTPERKCPKCRYGCPELKDKAYETVVCTHRINSKRPCADCCAEKKRRRTEARGAEVCSCPCHSTPERNKKVSSCCATPMRYIDDFLCCASCGKSCTPVSPTPESRLRDSLIGEFNDFIRDKGGLLNLQIQTPVIDDIITFWLSKLSQERELLVGEIDIEQAAEAVHNAYLDTCKKLGWEVKPTNLVPYAELTEDSKELDRASVRAVLALLKSKN